MEPTSDVLFLDGKLLALTTFKRHNYQYYKVRNVVTG